MQFIITDIKKYYTLNKKFKREQKYKEREAHCIIHCHLVSEPTCLVFANEKG
jgi:hypothetical protein